MGKINNNNRIVYVEPNDVYGQVDGKPMTPDYTDYCIYCNLTVESTSRLKNNYAGEDSSGNYSVAADLSGGQQGVEYTTFFSGVSEDYNYLTTDYTDIHFNSVKEKTFVEGLQITGIDINYANRMCPMIVMHMVDIRGSGLFAREEAVHVNGDIKNLEVDKEGKIIDNIYSGFMSFPYPKYRLQLKGFYGRAVTYQLACSSFVGNFDSTTGNFNITVTFIGYEYGCLQDLPLSYIIAAPLTKSGKAYWNIMKKTPAWNLYMKPGTGNAEPPIRLIDLFKNIKAATDKLSKGESLGDNIADTSLEVIEKEFNQKNALITSINNAVNDFNTKLEECNQDCFILTIDDDDKYGDKVTVIFSQNGSLNITDDVADKYNQIGSLIQQYSEIYGYDGIGLSVIPNFEAEEWDINSKWQRGTEDLQEFFDVVNKSLIVKSADGNQTQITLINNDGEYDLNDSRIKIRKLRANGLYSFNSKQSYTIYKDFILKQNTNAAYKYASVIVYRNFCKFSYVFKQIEAKYNDYKTRISEGTLVTIDKLTGGLTPYIGNYYKMIFCHVDTFIHTMKLCVDDIYAEIGKGDRKPERLGIYNNKITDVPQDLYNPGINDGVIPPFPAIYKNYGDDESSDAMSGNTAKVIGWVGNVKGPVPFREIALVNEYYNALRYIDSETADVPWTTTDDDEIVFNLLPCFLQDKQENKNVFLTRDGLAYYSGIMGAVVLGSMNYKESDISSKEAELIGAILAKNIFDGCDDKERLSKIIEGELSDSIRKIATISDVNGDNETKRFEFATGNSSYDNRHRIFDSTEYTDYLKYVYLQTNNGYPIIPLDSFDKWNELPTKYNIVNVVGKEDKDYSRCEPTNIIDGDYVITEPGKDFINSVGDVSDDTFLNSTMFSIWNDACNVSLVESNIEAYRTSDEGIGDYTNKDLVSKILDKYWLSADNFENYHSIDPDNLIGNQITVPDYVTDAGVSIDNDTVNKLLKLDY